VENSLELGVELGGSQESSGRASPVSQTLEAEFKWEEGLIRQDRRLDQRGMRDCWRSLQGHYSCLFQHTLLSMEDAAKGGKHAEARRS
jgi:hypothetical protein